MLYSRLDDPVQWLADTARQVGATIENNSLILNGSDEKGSIRLFPLEEGLTMILTDIKSRKDIPILRPSAKTDYLFIKLYLPEYHFDTAVKSDFESYVVKAPGALLYNSHLELQSLFKAGRHVKIASFVMHTDWLRQTMHHNSVFSDERLFEKPLLRFENVTPSMLQSALNLFTAVTDAGTFNLRMKAIAYDILSDLISAFDKRALSNVSAFKLQSDMEAIFQVRKQLLIIENSGHLTIDILAKNAAMSPSKLKTLFRSVFGIPIFEFYQQHRLNYARHLIEGRELTISEVGLKIGYINLSKFSRAYKKQFGYLPHQTLLPDRAII